MSDAMKADIAAPKVGMSARTLLRKAKAGEIGCIRDGRLISFLQEHLDEYLASHTITVAPPPPPLPARNPRYANR